MTLFFILALSLFKKIDIEVISLLNFNISFYFSVHSSLQIEIIAGDSWAGVGLLVVAKEGGWILRYLILSPTSKD